MATCDIQVANPSLLNKIESFLNDPSYKETIENSANYNTRLCVERRMRMPFLDSQTGVAQNHSNLFMNARQRLPGLVEGQIYSYPSKRWRKKRRQYLMTFMQPRRKELDPELDLHTISTVENPAALNEDSKDSMHLKDETAKDAWYYDELDMQDVEGYDDPDPDSDYDYEESYSKRKRRRGGKMSRGGGRGRKKATTPSYDINFDAEKPFACERNTRRGRQPASSQSQPPTGMGPVGTDDPLTSMMGERKKPAAATSSSSSSGPAMEDSTSSGMPGSGGPGVEFDRHKPSTYCDFCLGDATQNKKTGQSEELVSCSDCGRSGKHTTNNNTSGGPTQSRGKKSRRKNQHEEIPWNSLTSRKRQN